MRIGVIGAGSMGTTLARHLGRVGHELRLASSRGPESLGSLAAELGATAASARDAARAADVVLLAIPTKAIAQLPRGILAAAPDAVIVDVSNYHPKLRDGHIPTIDRGAPESIWIAQQLGRPVVKAFNHILASSLRDRASPKGSAGRIALAVAGDSRAAKAIVLRLVDEVGFDPVDAGELADSFRQQTGAPAYCRDLGAADLRRALAEADVTQLAAYRAAREAFLEKSHASGPP